MRPYFLITSDFSKRTSEESKIVGAWVQQGFIDTCETPTVDYWKVKDHIEHRREVGYNIRQINFDPNESTMLQMALSEMGFEIGKFAQSFGYFNAALRPLSAAITDGRVLHDGNPVMTWMLANAMAEYNDALQVRLTKKKSMNKIDGAVALAMAYGAYITDESSEYDGMIGG